MNRSRHHLLPMGLFLMAALGAATEAAAQGFSPADRATLEGSTSTAYPLGRFNARIQQLHGDLRPDSSQISGHAYRRDATLLRGTVPAFQVDLEISLSMSPREAGDPSRNFADNRGPNPTLVLPRTVVSFPATARPDQDPAPLPELLIPYAQPFTVPSGGGTLCLETVIYGNIAPSGPDRNFQVYLDAHELFPDGRNEQPGFRFGEGCVAEGQSSSGHASFQLTQWGPTMDLEISARNGVPDDGSNLAWSYLMVSANPFQAPLPYRLDCTQGTAVDIFLPLGPNDVGGDWNGILAGIPRVALGQRFYLQVGSAHLGTGAVALGDISMLTVPPRGPAIIPASRIAHGSDRDATAGAISLSVPVTLFF